MINWTRVDELTDEIGKAEFGEVVEIFLEEVDDAISRLAASTELEADLHFLKGSALNLGFTDFSKACQIGELVASRGKQDSIDVAEILDCYAKSRAAFLAGLATRSAA